MKDKYVIVPSPTAEKWFTTYDIAVVNEATFNYIASHAEFFDPNGNVILEGVEMGDLIIAREQLGLSKEQVPEELFVGIVPQQVGTVTRKGDTDPEAYRGKNSILIGTASEISNTVLTAFSEFYKWADAEAESHPKTARERFEERRKKRRKNRKK